MKIAYIISAYKDAEHLLRLVDSLDSQADFYVHVDANVDMSTFRALLGQKVVFVPRHRISWGGWLQVEYQRELLQAVLDSGIDYLRIVCLSGQDYPLWTNAHIHQFFSQNPDTEFIAGYNVTCGTDLGQQSKIRQYHLFRDLNAGSSWLKNKIVVASRHVMHWLHARKPLQVWLDGRMVDVYIGSDYWAITPRCAKYVVDALGRETRLVRYFKTSFVPSEMCLHTIIFNSPFAPKALIHSGRDYPGLSVLTPLHYIDYRGSVRILDESYADVLRKSGRMFCRKVVTGQSDRLVELFERY